MALRFLRMGRRSPSTVSVTVDSDTYRALADMATDIGVRPEEMARRTVSVGLHVIGCDRRGEPLLVRGGPDKDPVPLQIVNR